MVCKSVARIVTPSLICALSIATAHASESIKAKIDSGVLIGQSDGGIKVFKGVPFAKPPVGSLRWAPPLKPDAWRGERDVTRFALPCPQPVTADGKPNGGGVAGAYDEDCLYLNVWAPANAKNAPVLFWVHGGAGFLGAGHLGTYDGSAFARDGVIVVSINYRLGLFGNFAHPALTKAAKPMEPLVNYGLMDSIEGMRWVKRNIGAFGGDPSNVALAGQSAGGGMIMALLSTPSAKGLFSKVILQSANPFAIVERGDKMLHSGLSLQEAEAAGAKSAAALGLPGSEASVEQLRGVAAKTIVETQATSRNDVGYALDGRLRTTNTADAIRNGTAIDVPVMVGRTSGEQGLETVFDLARLIAAKTPTFVYQFVYVPEWKKSAQPNGAPHSAELVYTFDSWETSSSGGASVTTKDREVAARMHSCWVAFAKSTSRASSLTCADNFAWPAYTADNDTVAIFADKPTLGKGKSIPPFVPQSRN